MAARKAWTSMFRSRMLGAFARGVRQSMDLRQLGQGGWRNREY